MGKTRKEAGKKRKDIHVALLNKNPTNVDQLEEGVEAC